MTNPKDKEPLVWLEKSQLEQSNHTADSTRYALSVYGLPRKKTFKQRLKHTFNQLLCRVFGHKTGYIRIRNSYVFQCPRCKAVWK